MSLRPLWRLLLALPIAAVGVVPVFGQAEHHHHEDTPPAEPTWTWSWGANVFAGWNYQLRKFRDFDAIESQNWLMGAGERKLGPGRVRFHSMLSLEPFTIVWLGFAGALTVHQRGARIAGSVPDRRDLREGAAHRLPASTRSVHGPRRHVGKTDRHRSRLRRGRCRRRSRAGAAAVHAPRLGAGESHRAAVAPSARLHAYHARCRHRRHRAPRG